MTMQNDAERQMAMFGEIGSARRGVDSTGRPSSNDVPNELRGDKRLRKLREMRMSDAIVGSLVMAIKMIARSVTWTAEPNTDTQENDTQAEDAVRFLDECMHDMSMPWAEFIDDSLDAVWAGFSIPEIVYKQRIGSNPGQADIAGELVELGSSAFDDGRVGWRKIAYRDPVGVTRWDIDNHGGIRGFWHQAEGNEFEVYIPIEKVILFRASRDGNSPYGLSWLMNGFEAWQYKRKHQWLEAVGLERAGLGLPTVSMPAGSDTREGSTDITRARNLVKSVRNDSYAGVVIPPGTGPQEYQQWKFELKASGGNAAQYADPIIKRYINEIMTSTLSQFLVQGMNSRGSYAMSKDHRDLWQLAMSGLLQTWEELINRFLVRPLFELNESSFPDRTKWPRIVVGEIGDVEIQPLMQFIHTMYGDGILDVSDEDRNRIRDIIGWPEETQEQIDARNAAEEEQQQQQIAQQAEALHQQMMAGQQQQPDDADEYGAMQASELSGIEAIIGKPISQWDADDHWEAWATTSDD